MKIEVKNFKGVIPRYDRKKLPADAAQTAFNCDVSSGSLELFEGISAADCGGTTPSSISPVKIAVPNPPTLATSAIFDPSTAMTVTLVSSVTSDLGNVTFRDRLTYLWSERTPYGIDWAFGLEGTNTRDIGISGTTKIWWTYQITIGEKTIPTVLRDGSTAEDGSFDFYSDTYLYATGKIIKQAEGILGIALYTDHVLLVYNGDPYQRIIKMNMNYTVPYDQYLTYRLTFEDPDDNEGPPSVISSKITRRKGDAVKLTFAGIATEGDKTPSKIHIYRAEHGTEDEKYHHLAEVKYGTATYDDTVASNSILGYKLPLYNGTQPSTPLWGNPPDSMTDVLQMPSMWYAGYIDDTVYFSGVRDNNHRWPSAYDLTFDYDIVKIINSGNTLLVLTKGGCYAVYGDRPYEHWVLELTNRCCSSASAVSKLGEDVYYISPDGIIKANGHSAVLISKSFFMPKDWRDLTPLTMTLTARGDRLFAFTASTSVYNYIFDFDLAGANVIETDRISATFTATQMTWKSREYVFDKAQIFSWGRVLADSYTSVIFRLYRNNVLVFQKQVSDNNAFILGQTEQHKYWSIEVIAKSTVHEIAIAQSEDEFYEKT